MEEMTAGHFDDQSAVGWLGILCQVLLELRLGFFDIFDITLHELSYRWRAPRGEVN